MILTLYYMYATFVQRWRLSNLKNKLNGTLNSQNALLVSSGKSISDPNHKRCLENLLFQKENRIACTIVPKQKFNLNQWLTFPIDPKCFPIHFGATKASIKAPYLYVLFQAHLETFSPHQSDTIEMETYGELVAWRLSNIFEVILKTDIDKLTKLMHCFSNSNIDINHDLKLLKFETIDIEGVPKKIKYVKTYSIEDQLKYNYAPIHWRKFVKNIQNLYAILNEETSKLMIENGTKPKEIKTPNLKAIKKAIADKIQNPSAIEKPHTSTIEKNAPKSKPDTVTTSGVAKKPQIEKTLSKNTLEVRGHGSSHRKKEHKTEKKLPATAATNEDKPVVVATTTTELEPKKGKHHHSSKDQKHKYDLPKLSITTSKDKKEPKKSSDKTKSYSEAAQTSSGAKNLQRQNATSSKETSPNKSVANTTKVKPPNILVYAESVLAKDNVKDVLKHIINKEKYTIYDLPVNVSSHFWDNSTTLVIVCGNVTPNLTTHLLEYLVTGGQLLCLCSDLLYSVLQTFSTAEVREHELVRFSYGEWKRVKMMHHIFCYQASPAKKQFSKDSDASSQSNGSSPIAPRTPNSVDIQHNGKTYTIQVQILGAEETWQTPSLLLATVKKSVGKAIFSQVHLEVDPTQYQDDENKYAALKDSNQARLEILKHILANHLDIDCQNDGFNVEYTPGYFLGRHELKLHLLNNCDNVINNRLESDDIALEFCGKGIEPGLATSSRLPILIVSCPLNFSTVHYFETLETKSIGRLVIYSDILTSSQHILTKKLHHGIVVIPQRQTAGKGRSNNKWLSPEGCAMFSLQLHINLNSTLGQSLSLVQHLVMVAIISAVKSIPGLEDLEIGLKWPNDLYAHSSIKIGGLVVNSCIFEDEAVVNVGCGINLNNTEPTVCLNDLIAKHNLERKLQISPIKYEKFFALVFNEVERILDVVQGGNLEYLFELYYWYWLHSDAKITVTTAAGEATEVTVMGVDNFGFLLVRSDDGTTSSVQPDGNSFDMLKGLIAPKIS